MAKIGAVTIACAETPLPLAPPDRFSVLDQEGMADQSTLFETDRWAPFDWPIILTAKDRPSLIAVYNQVRALRKTKVDITDDASTFKKALICRVVPGEPRFSGVVVGGTAVGDTWEMPIVVTILPASE